MFKADHGANFGPEMTALANGWINDFGGKSKFIYTLPGSTLAPKITAPAAIKGENQAIQIKDWNDYNIILNAIAP